MAGDRLRRALPFRSRDGDGPALCGSRARGRSSRQPAAPGGRRTGPDLRRRGERWSPALRPGDGALDPPPGGPLGRNDAQQQLDLGAPSGRSGNPLDRHVQRRRESHIAPRSALPLHPPPAGRAQQSVRLGPARGRRGRAVDRHRRRRAEPTRPQDGPVHLLRCARPGLGIRACPSTRTAPACSGSEPGPAVSCASIRAPAASRASATTPSDPTTLSIDNIWDIVETREGELLLAGQDGVDVFDPRTGKARRLASLYPGAGAGLYFSALLDSHGNYWLGSNNGVQRVETASGRVRTYPERPDDEQGLGPYAVFDLVEDGRGNVWAATEWGGLVCFRSGDAAQRRYDTRNGLPGASVASILADANGDLWLGTNRGLCRFAGASDVPENPRILCFDVRDGLQGYEYARGTRWRCRDGEMIFGGHGGLDAFFPQDIVANPTRPPVVLTGLRLSTRPVAVGAPGSPLSVSLPEARELTFSYDQPVLTFEFAALNYLVPRKNQYQYRLLGLQDEWSVPNTEHSATYTNLSPGSYVLQVRASNNDGVWNEEGTSLRIRVTPPFWKAAWFRALLALGPGLRPCPALPPPDHGPRGATRPDERALPGDPRRAHAPGARAPRHPRAGHGGDPAPAEHGRAPAAVRTRAGGPEPRARTADARPLARGGPPLRPGPARTRPRERRSGGGHHPAGPADDLQVRRSRWT